MSQHRIVAPVAYCPNPTCTAVLTGYLCAIYGVAAHPQTGDLTVCAYCGELACYANDMGELRVATPDDLADTSPMFRAALNEASAFIKRQHRTPPARRQ